MPRDRTSLQPPDGRDNRLEPVGNECPPPSNDLSLAMAGMLVLASLAILVILAYLPTTECLPGSAGISISAKQDRFIRRSAPSVVFDMQTAGRIEAEPSESTAGLQTGLHRTLPTSDLAEAGSHPGPDGLYAVPAGVDFPPASTAGLAMKEQNLPGGQSGSGELQTRRLPRAGNLSGSPEFTAEPAAGNLPLSEFQSIGQEGSPAATDAWRAHQGVPLPADVAIARDAREMVAVLLQRASASPGQRDFRAAAAVNGCEASGCNADATSARGICDRTEAVQHAILEHLRNSAQPVFQGDCQGVTDEWLARVASVRLAAPHATVEALKPGDFTGLSGVRVIHISHQPQLRTLPGNLFNGLGALEEVWVHHNPAFSALPAGVFRELPRLQFLNLNDNWLARLEPGAFAELPSLKTLLLQRNRLQTFPFDEFEALPALTTLDLAANPGYHWAIEPSETSLEVSPGQSGIYRVRLTAQPCFGGTAVNLRWRTLGWGVEVPSPKLIFTQNNWFRSQSVTVTANADAGSQARMLAHEVRDWCYRDRMNHPPPNVMVSVDSGRQLWRSPIMAIEESRAGDAVDDTPSLTVNIGNSAQGHAAVDIATVHGSGDPGADHGISFGALTLSSGPDGNRAPGLNAQGCAGEDDRTPVLACSGAPGAQPAGREPG